MLPFSFSLRKPGFVPGTSPGSSQEQPDQKVYVYVPFLLAWSLTKTVLIERSSPCFPGNCSPEMVLVNCLVVWMAIFCFKGGKTPGLLLREGFHSRVIAQQLSGKTASQRPKFTVAFIHGFLLQRERQTDTITLMFTIHSHMHSLLPANVLANAPPFTYLLMTSNTSYKRKFLKTNRQTIDVFYLRFVFYLRLGNRKQKRQKRPNPNFRTWGTVGRKDQTGFPVSNKTKPKLNCK